MLLARLIVVRRCLHWRGTDAGRQAAGFTVAILPKAPRGASGGHRGFSRYLGLVGGRDELGRYAVGRTVGRSVGRGMPASYGYSSGRPR